MRIRGHIVVKRHRVGGRLVFTHYKGGQVLHLATQHQVGKKVIAMRAGGGINTSIGHPDEGAGVLPSLRGRGAQSARTAGRLSEGPAARSGPPAAGLSARARGGAARRAPSMRDQSDGHDDLLDQLGASFRKRRVVRMRG